MDDMKLTQLYITNDISMSTNRVRSLLVSYLDEAQGNSEVSTESYLSTLKKKPSVIDTAIRQEQTVRPALLDGRSALRMQKLVPMARGLHLFPCRTQQLSLAAVTILGF